ncbi:MAG: hypothetical protein ACLGIR_09085 [Actinomycetes bacterium]
MLVPTGYLRAFQPLDAFPPPERARWEAYVAAGAGVSLSESLEVEASVTRARLLTGRMPRLADAALVRRAGERVHVCPLQLDLRAATALRELRAEVPEPVVAELVPDQAARDALDLLAASGRVPHILDAPWAIPLHWFAAFDPEERHLVDPPEGRGPRLTYLTTAGQAAGRIEDAIVVVEETIEDGEDVLAALADVGAWLDLFDDTAIVELDYGSLVACFDRVELEGDRTCHEVTKALEGLADGDPMAAAAYYGVARSRWGALRGRQHAS